MSVDWPGLLKWSIEHGNAELLNSPDFQAMDEDRRMWLEEALKTMSADQIEIMKSCGEALSQPDTEESIPKKLEALETLSDIIEDLDNARDLHLVGAFQPVVSALGSTHSGVRAGAANIILVCVQNNEPCKQFAMELNALEPLLALMKEDTDMQVKFKCLGAVSALVRDFPPGHEKMCSIARITALLRPLLEPPASAQCTAKALFLLAYLFNLQKSHIDAAIEDGIDTQAPYLTKHEDLSVREMALRATYAKNLVDVADQAELEKAIDALYQASQ
jgi:hypothetical protein